MKHVPIQTREQLVNDWFAKRPSRTNTEAWGFWLIDMAHDLERFDRRERWARERVFS